jgi:hypothetical protein
LADELEIIRTGKPIIDYEEKETWSDRVDTWVSTTKMPLRDGQGKIIGTFGVSRSRRREERRGFFREKPLRRDCCCRGCGAEAFSLVRTDYGKRIWSASSLLYSLPSNAAFRRLMSSFCICHNAFNIRCVLSMSLAFNISPTNVGTICHEMPYLSFSQPQFHGLSAFRQFFPELVNFFLRFTIDEQRYSR